MSYHKPHITYRESSPSGSLSVRYAAKVTDGQTIAFGSGDSPGSAASSAYSQYLLSRGVRTLTDRLRTARVSQPHAQEKHIAEFASTVAVCMTI